MTKPSPIKVLQATTIGYGFLLVLMYHMSYAQTNNKICILSHPSTYFKQSSSKIYLEHDAVGIQLHVPEVLSMGYKTLKAHNEYYLTLFNSSLPQQAFTSDEDHLQQLQELYSNQIQLYPQCPLTSPLCCSPCRHDPPATGSRTVQRLTVPSAGTKRS